MDWTREEIHIQWQVSPFLPFLLLEEVCCWALQCASRSRQNIKQTPLTSIILRGKRLKIQRRETGLWCSPTASSSQLWAPARLLCLTRPPWLRKFYLRGNKCFTDVQQTLVLLVKRWGEVDVWPRSDKQDSGSMCLLGTSDPEQGCVCVCVCIQILLLTTLWKYPQYN